MKGFRARTHYVYYHKIEDKIFYVGKGINARGFDCEKRNPIWRKTVRQNNFQFDVEIAQWFLTSVEACGFEAQEIKRLKPKANKSIPALIGITNRPLTERRLEKERTYAENYRRSL
jgi:hypothetical protein